VVSREGGWATDADRQLRVDWAAGWTSAASITVSELIDLEAAGHA
jgi:hypothetical protein